MGKCEELEREREQEQEQELELERERELERMIHIGIDPGVNGGIAMLAEDSGRVIGTWKMPSTERDLIDMLDVMEPAHATLERVSASPQMGVVSAFTFGKGYGGLMMALSAVRIPFDLVSPVKWQNALGCRSGGDKNVTKRRAQQLFPNVKITHAIADALLLAEYGRRSHLQRSATPAIPLTENRREKQGEGRPVQATGPISVGGTHGETEGQDQVENQQAARRRRHRAPQGHQGQATQPSTTRHGARARPHT